MADNGFANEYFTLEVTGNKAIIKDKAGDTLNLTYDSAEKHVLAGGEEVKHSGVPEAYYEDVGASENGVPI